jgi:hypothetical protein
MDDFQFDEIFYDEDQEQTKFEVEEHYGYDDLASGLPMETNYDF